MKPLFPQPRAAAMRGQHLGVDGLHRLHRGMRGRPLHASRRNSSAFFLIKRFAAAAAFSGVMTGRTGVSTIEPPLCRLMLTWSPTLRRARSIRAVSNIRPCELPIFVIVLVMPLNYVLPAIPSSPLAGAGFWEDGQPTIEQPGNQATKH